MEKEEKFRFYNKYDLKGLVYNINLPSKNKTEILSLSKKISDLGGVIKTPNNRKLLIFRKFHLVYQLIQ
jgi:hypothetical protein